MTAPVTRLRARLRRTRRGRDESGAAAVWMLIITITAFVALVGIVGGGGELINEQSNARRVAEQAARAGADERPGGVAVKRCPIELEPISAGGDTHQRQRRWRWQRRSGHHPHERSRRWRRRRRARE